ncbi:aldo/keto reductase [Limosilactobacillus difficilis]|uniref:aldo/keto reductase n=1 Tax=Limosilactobacillus difficilis TaxID=2991838 RepID=UPI0024BBB7C7|nr:aldo/keto reductase [Limosilactobacillus difficilis]
MTILAENYQLNNGIAIPKIALGTWLIDNDDVADAVKNAIKLGYRHIDTAQAYGNEQGVGKGIRESGVARDQIFVTDKVAAELKDYDSVAESIDKSLATMELDYLDLLIIHSPQPWKEVNQSDDRYYQGNLAAWHAMSDAMKAGKVKSIGVSNFNQGDLQNILDNSDVKPAVDQILAHIANTPKDLIKFCQDNDIQVEAYSPIGHGAVLDQADVKKVAAKYRVSPAQLCLKYDLQLGMVILPKTANPEHMKQNADLDFQISDDDMKTLENVKKLTDYGQANMFPVYGGKL